MQNLKVPIMLLSCAEAQGMWLLNRVLYGAYIDFPQMEEQ